MAPEQVFFKTGLERDQQDGNQGQSDHHDQHPLHIDVHSADHHAGGLQVGKTAGIGAAGLGDRFLRLRGILGDQLLKALQLGLDRRIRGTAVLEERSAALEEGIAALALSAGSAAVNYSILNIAEQGSNIVTVPLLYGGTYTLFNTVPTAFVPPEDQGYVFAAVMLPDTSTQNSMLVRLRLLRFAAR